ncbi:NAD(P)H-dependent oxidoreductase subunit E [Thermosipho atlanticus]|uniref:Thioredoxin-like [2Fe-2S] ferredoxin n=1 Tax=Thermosipho atlanticus DSM 15807 TaxID=1123380 RepID=A0A1M5T8K6_9BACT|nr:NAD(P)H-dependent oxidoreductase subunit E [Thermosipho atlanticus]SHH47051.1 Thioredoxin-like [2Fe-2S] ferredoxin [Thermosipho atlanticus DSM 15807]
MNNLKKINVEICVGTACHLMGSNALVNMVETLSDEVKKHLNFKYSLCFGDCNKGHTPPIVRVNDTTYTSVTPEKLREIIFSCLEEIK